MRARLRASWILLAAFGVVMACIWPARALAASESYALLADTHLGLPGLDVYGEVEDALCWASELPGLKAVAVAGDVTDRGDEVAFSEWEFLCDSILGDGVARIQALGDHDTGKWGAYLEVDPALTVKNGYRNFKLVNGGSATSFHSFKYANVMTVGGVRAPGHSVITDGMLKQLNARLLKTARQGKVALVVCHYPYDSSALNKRAKLMGILRSYPNVVYVSGHKHLYSAKAQNRLVRPSCSTTPYGRQGFDVSTKYPFRSIGVNAASTYRAGGYSYADVLSVSPSGRMVLKKWNLTRGKLHKAWTFSQTRSSVTVKTACSSARYPKKAKIKYKVRFSDGKTYGGVRSGSTFTLRIGQKKKFSGIPAGVLVTVRPVKAPAGWKKGGAVSAEVGKTSRTLRLTSSYSAKQKSSSLKLRAR